MQTRLFRDQNQNQNFLTLKTKIPIFNSKSLDQAKCHAEI